MPRRNWISTLLNRQDNPVNKSFIRFLTSGSVYKLSDINTDSVVSNIKAIIDSMRALSNDSQVSTALSYYATDSTITNSEGQIIWATPKDNVTSDVADIINDLFRRWNINSYARDHILELATIGNLYIPTTLMNKADGRTITNRRAVIDNNTIPDYDFDIMPSYKLLPEDVLHLYKMGEPVGYLYQPENDITSSEIYPESAIIHFSLGGLLGDYTIDIDENGELDEYDIKFATPLLLNALQPTQILNLLENALVLSSMIKTVKFVNVECGNTDDETEIQNILQEIKMCIEQQLSLNTSTGQSESFLNMQSPNNLIYLPRTDGQDAISITDLNMNDTTENDNKLLDYYQDKKLSVLGVPKEAMNFSATEGLGGAGSVLSQRSAIYANILQRIKTAYISGWTQAINTYFTQRGYSSLVDKFELHMAEIVTTQSTVTFEKRDAALNQASTLVQLLKDIGVSDTTAYKDAIEEILSEVLPITSGEVQTWDVDLAPEEGGGPGGF